jgi:hypothetical protein
MECPKCKNKMQVKQDDASFGENKKQYKRTVYWCREDDIWVKIEMPVEEDSI